MRCQNAHDIDTASHPLGKDAAVDLLANWAGERVSVHDFIPAAVLLALGIIALSVAKLYPSGDGHQYAVVAPPWLTLGQKVSLVQSARGKIVEMSGARHVVVAYSEDPDFVRELYRAGAWLVLDPVNLRGCGSEGAGHSRGSE
jgi:hypothetical protein